ncbi:hypothetical protein NPIL_84201 [Nephila pilipes]|uniref:Uncharacterized protein n=1 Tax=Nephila pilipes TaxID=299642 RepID=A0A8X6QCJ6_NEPPI|nr:hypothetical protein NPIL_84201 [Nephila pilipes]
MKFRISSSEYSLMDVLIEDLEEHSAGRPSPLRNRSPAAAALAIPTSGRYEKVNSRSTLSSSFFQGSSVLVINRGMDSL